MEKKSSEAESEPVVYEIRGEPAVVINGVPKIDPDISTLSRLIPTRKLTSLGKTKGAVNGWKGGKFRNFLGGKYYYGKVIQLDKENGWYRVEYEDGDSEDLDWVELEEVLLPVDIGVPLKTVALKVLNKDQKAGELVVPVPGSEIQKAKQVGKKGKKTRAR